MVRDNDVTGRRAAQGERRCEGVMLVDKPAGKRDREEEGAAERGKQSRDSTQELIVCLEGAAGEEEMLVHIRNGFRRPEIRRVTRSVASQAPEAYTLNLSKSDRRKRKKVGGASGSGSVNRCRYS